MSRRKNASAQQDVDPRQLLDSAVEERDLQKNVFELAHDLNYLVFHTYDSVLGSKAIDAGFPDAILVKAGRVLAIEFKREDGKVSTAQSHWLLELSWLGRVETYVWRPRHWSSGEVERVLLGLEYGGQRSA